MAAVAVPGAQRLRPLRFAAPLVALCLLPAAGDTSIRERIYATAQAQLDREDFEAACRTALRGYQDWRFSAGSRWHWRFRLQLAECLNSLEHYDETTALLADDSPFPELEARRGVDVAFLRLSVRDIAAASRDLDTAEPLAAAHQPELLTQINLMRGLVLTENAKPEDAERVFLRVLATPGMAGTLAECHTLINLGYADLHQFRYDEAKFWFERARKAAIDLKTRRAESLAAGNLGVCYLWLGDNEGALKLLDSAASLAASLNIHIYQESWLENIGQAYDALRDYGHAREYFERARQLAQPGVEDEWLTQILADLAGESLRVGNMAEAERLNSQAISLADKVDRDGVRIAPRLNAARIALARQQYDASENEFEKAIALSRTAADPISQWECYAGLAELHRACRRPAEAEKAYGRAIQTIEGERSKITQDEEKLTFLSNLIRFYGDYVDFLVDRGQPERAFEVAAASRARVLAEKLHRPQVNSGGILRGLRATVARTESIVMSYWLGPRRSFLWVIDTGGLHFFILPPEPEITARVMRWNQAIQNEEDLSGGSSAGQWLFTQLIAAHYRVPAGSRIILAPDAALYELNFETLPSGDDRHFWIRDVSIAIAPSLALETASESRPQPRLLLIADPDFVDAQFPRLPNVKSEIETVSRHFANPDVYRSAAATPAAYRLAPVATYSTMHFAAHAIANPESPLDSAIILSGPGANHKLYAREVMDRPLNAELVTLSACSTAGNKTYGGEGLTGFAWAFLSAGASNIVAGLWDVDDRATGDLMARFYDALSVTRSPAAALREAKLGLMDSNKVYRKPAYWAAFETFTRVVYPGKSGFRNPLSARTSAPRPTP